MKSYGHNVDEDGIQLAAVSDAIAYDRPLPLYTRTVGTGKILCELLRPNRAARRLVRLTATYRDGDTTITSVRMCDSELDEQAALRDLETKMLHALARPSNHPHDTPK